MTDCTSFERHLAALAGGEVPDDERAAAIARLETHARACTECASAQDLLRLLAAPPGERDLADAPGEDYWDGFERKLESRLRTAGAPVARSRPPGLVLAAAAIGAFALVGVWLVLREGAPPATKPPAGERASAQEAPPPTVPEPSTAIPETPLAEAEPEAGSERPAPLPQELTAGLADALGGPAGEHLDDLVGWGTGWADEGLFPDIGALDADARRKLLRWLEEQS